MYNVCGPVWGVSGHDVLPTAPTPPQKQGIGGRVAVAKTRTKSRPGPSSLLLRAPPLQPTDTPEVALPCARLDPHLARPPPVDVTRPSSGPVSSWPRPHASERKPWTKSAPAQPTHHDSHSSVKRCTPAAAVEWRASSALFRASASPPAAQAIDWPPLALLHLCGRLFGPPPCLAANRPF